MLYETITGVMLAFGLILITVCTLRDEDFWDDDDLDW